MPVSAHKHMQTHKTTHLQSHTPTQTHLHTHILSLSLFLTHTQTRKKLLRNEPWHCLSQSEALIRICSQDLLLSTHTNTHEIWERRKGGKKAEGHVGGKRGTRQHLQSPLLIALLPAWSQITGLEMLQSGLYLLANLPTLQIHTSKPPSYHLLVNLQRRKGHRDTVKSNSFPLSFSFFLCLHLFLPLCRSLSLWGSVHPRQNFPGLGKVQGDVFSPLSSPLSWSFDVRVWSHKSLSIYHQRSSPNSGLGTTPHG